MGREGSTRRTRSRVTVVGAILLAALGAAQVIEGTALASEFAPLIDGGGSSDGGARFLNAAIGVGGAVLGLVIAAFGLLQVGGGAWALARPSELAVVVAALLAAFACLLGVLLIGIAQGPRESAVAAAGLAAALAATCLLGIGARRAARTAPPLPR